MKKTQLALATIAVNLSLFLLFSVESKILDPYKVLGVDRKASQRDIQKVFHKLSLQYHPDKNKAKGAQEKFSEINNAYDLLSDEEKRKNYDLYGDEKGAPGFDAGGAGDHGGYTYFTSGGPGQSGFSFKPGDWQNMGGQGGGSKSFSFSFGGPSNSRSSFGFGLNDMFSKFFGGGSDGSQFGGFSSSGRSQSAGPRNTPKKIPSVNAQVYRKEIAADKGIAWLILTYTSNARGIQPYESVIGETATPLDGALKVGSVNCEIEASFCKELGIYPRYAPRVFVYSYRSSEGGSLVEYNGDLNAKSLKTFCQEHLPRFSKRINLDNLNFDSGTVGGLPKVMLLSTKKYTPVIWRALSGLYRKQFVFYDAEVHDTSDPSVKKLGVDALPAIVGWLSNGEKHTIKTGISVKDLKSAIQDLSSLLDKFEKLDKKVASAQSKKMEYSDRRIPLLAGSNFDDICGYQTPVCIIGAFRSSEAKDKMEKILLWVSQMSLSRRQTGSRASVSYALLDAAMQQSFLTAFEKTGFKSSDTFLLAYKPKRGKFAMFSGEITGEDVEKFIGSVLNGDVQFQKTRQKPVVK